ncbi:MAG: hypothetical protein M3044_07580 [Thermoproteota archaeon]|nr:hypothetical protein [Thermoproteota archaeon]
MLIHTTILPIKRERIITIGIIAGLFGGLVGGPIASLVDYYASPTKRLWLFLVPEFVGFVFLGLMVIVYNGKSRKKQASYDKKDRL